MTAETPEAVARSILAAIQAAADAHDPAALLDLLTDDAVLVGTAAANLERPAVEAYVEGVFSLDETIRWSYDEIRVVDARQGAVTFVAIGSVGLSDEAPEAFRLTCLAVQAAGHWRLRLFHGSVPQA